MYVFDAFLMAAVVAASAIIHPSEMRALLHETGIAMAKVVLTKQVSMQGSVSGGDDAGLPLDLGQNDVHC